MRQRAIVIAGPTACGKSDVAISIAGRLGGEIISADSRQVYRGMDIGTGKVEGRRDFSFGISCPEPVFPFVSGGIRHWLIDVADPCDEFTVADFQRISLAVSDSVFARGRRLIVAGGTGFFVRSLTDGLDFPDVSVSQETRDLVRAMTAEEAASRLAELSQDAPGLVDMKNPRRVARALELILSGLPSISDMRRRRDLGIDFMTIGITYPAEILRKRISDRLDARLAAGMVGEVRGLLDSGVPPGRLESFGLEYRWLGRHLAGLIGFDEMRERLYFDICRFAKRQMTWFRKYCGVIWVDGAESAFELASRFLETGERGVV